MRPQIVKNILAPAALYLFSCATMLGQADSGSSGPPEPSRGPTPPELGLPIDNGLLVLLIAGLIFGIYTANKIRAKRTVA
ncbi:hypothetical protein [Ulvibacter antarcticus]|uniref:Uncharacterized protein n=1 Tax=Ulvibacter antarcticus TaxID=442714 RepID=A0A3L9YZI1_9FLAO|nr:hypothetical protein [Ulvibacter antarcticus]RMA66046.1 hypothetical protein BXY75_0464 [Ulvibacter antarcticus]